jgi:hypothetical protein
LYSSDFVTAVFLDYIASFCPAGEEDLFLKDVTKLLTSKAEYVTFYP